MWSLQSLPKDMEWANNYICKQIHTWQLTDTDPVSPLPLTRVPAGGLVAEVATWRPILHTHLTRGLKVFQLLAVLWKSRLSHTKPLSWFSLHLHLPSYKVTSSEAALKVGLLFLRTCVLWDSPPASRASRFAVLPHVNKVSPSGFLHRGGQWCTSASRCVLSK